MLAVEDDPSDAVVRKLVRSLCPDVFVARSIGRTGYGKLKKQALSYNAAAAHKPFLLLTDLDSGECAPTLIEEWMRGIPRHKDFLFRVAVREVEAWVLADAVSLARFLDVPKALMPADPDALPNPKRTLVQLAGKSPRREVREALCPPAGSSRIVGPDYNGVLGRFVRDTWQPGRAREASPSLERAAKALTAFRRRGNIRQKR